MEKIDVYLVLQYNRWRGRRKSI